MRHCARVLYVAALLISAASPEARQNTSRTVPSVELFVDVTDPNQQFVSGLTQQEFEIYDNGTAQTITGFATSPRPLSVVIMLDTSGSMKDTIGSAKQAADEFLRRLWPADEGLVGSFNDKVAFYPHEGFTGNVQTLRTALAQITLGYPTALYDALGQSIEHLKSAPGRRVVVVFSDGEDNASRSNGKEVLTRARAANVMVCAIAVHNEYFDGQQRIRTSPDRGLKSLSADTGGEFFLLKTVPEWGPTFASVAEAIHRQYVIAFSPAVVDGKVHKLDVRMKKPGLIARAQKSYVLPKLNP